MKTSPQSDYDKYTLEELEQAASSVDREKYPEHYDEIHSRIKELSKLTHPHYKCRNCGSEEYEIGEIHVTGSNLGKFFDVQGTKFRTITCCQCGYTELYKCPKERWKNIVDFLIAG